VRIIVWIAVYVMALTAALKRHQDGWMSPRATDLTSSSVQNLLPSRTELDYRERDPIHGNARVRQGRDTGAYLGLVNYVRTFPAQSSADFKDHNTAHTRHPDAP
jgi:hypothetical protein